MVWDGEKRDTGWIDITPDAGNQDVSGALPRYRMVDGRVTFEGKIEKTSGSWTASATTNLMSGANALPVEFRPQVRKDFQAAGNSAASACKLLINTDGTVQIVTGATVPAYVALDVATFLTD